MTYLSPSREGTIVAVAKDGRAGLDPPPPATVMGIPSTLESDRTAREESPLLMGDDPPIAKESPSPRLSSESSAAADEPLVGTLELQVVDATNRAAMAGAHVELGTTSAAGEERVSRRRTDADGRLRIETNAGDLRVVAWDEHALSPRRKETLAAGETLEIVLELEPARSFSGTVSDAVTGDPVPEAEVRIWTHNETDRVHTGPDGTFEHPRFPALGKAQQVHVRAEGYGASIRYLKIEHTGHWSVLPAREGQPTVRGEEDPWIEIALVPERTLRGRVLNARGLPVVGASIAAEGFFRVLPAVASRDVASAISDEEGRFELGGLRSDIEHILTFVASDHAAETVTVESVAGVERDLGDVRLHGEATLVGHVTDADGYAVEDALVRLLPNMPISKSKEGDEVKASGYGLNVSTPLPLGERTLRTDTHGRFAFDNLTRADYRLSVERDEGPLAIRHVGANAFDNSSSMAEAELRVPATALVLQGQVEQDGVPVADALVQVRRHGHVASTRSDAEGRFRVSGLGGTALYEVSVERRNEDGSREHAQIRVFAHEKPLIRLPRKKQTNLAQAPGR